MTRLLSLALTILIMSPAVLGSDWPHVRGPGFDGRVAAPSALDGEALALDVDWRIKIGSGYSGIVIADGRAVTLFSDPEGNWVAAYDVESGKPAWRHRLGEPHKGFDGSDDGPLSSPLIGKGLVYALDPSGTLVALRLSDGNVSWTKRLEQDFDGKSPHFGFTTSPLLVGDVLVVQSGGADGRSVVGLNARNGDTKWAHGDDGVEYQSPSVMSLAGREQVVAVSATKITGMAAETGDVLWVHELEEGIRASSANPTFMGDDRFLVLVSGGARVFKVTGSGSEWSVEQLYVSESLGGSYAPPVYHEGHLYGFRGQVLTCVDASNGERVWRSRPPGGDGLILVGGHLVIFGSQGNVVVADASPEGYRERARVQALGGSSLTWPSFADGRVFVRNLGEMAAVSMSEGVATAQKTSPPVGDHDFGLWIAQVEASSSPQEMVDEFFRAHETLPFLEGEYVHFVYRGDAKDVSIHGSMLDTEVPESLTHVEGTDLFYRTYRLEPRTRWEYHYQVDFEEWTTDPRNDRSVPAAEGEESLSELVTPGYDVASHYGEPKGDQGRLDGFELTSETLGYEKAIQVWLPPGYDSSKASYPLLVVNDGDAWLEKGLMANTLDNLVGKSLQPVVVAFVEPSQRWWLEAGGTRTEEYVRMLAEELVPALQERYRLEADPSSRALMGNRFYAFSGIYATLRYPEVFGKAAAMSVYAGLGTLEDLETMVSEGAGPKLVFYVDWNRYDERNVDRDWNLSDDSKSLADLLQGGGYALTGGEILDSWGWGGWRNRTDRALIALYPLEQ